MSKHDPFDGIYDDGQAGASDTATSFAEQARVEPAVPDGSSEVTRHETYTRTQLERMRKAELQALARERNLDASGDRDDLIERINDAQRAETPLP